jgi:transcriptional regulator with XRE-family HTH domain
MQRKGKANMTFGERLAYTRKKKGLTRKQLADLIGVKPNTVSCWIRRHPSASMVRKMITALGLPENWFENDDNFKGKGTKPLKKITDFGKRLAFTRRKKGLLQKQLAEMIGENPSTISCWEADRKYPNVSAIQRISKALGVSEDWFENGDNFKGQDIKPQKKLTDFGKRLAYTRKKKGLLQRQLAKLIGVEGYHRSAEGEHTKK